MSLYWEQLQSIVPMQYAFNPKLLEDRMREMVRAGLIHAVIPAQHMYATPEFADPFIRYAERWVAKRGGRPFTQFSRVHAEKLESLVIPLHQLGVLQEDGHPWFKLPTPLANAFMSYLAASLGRLADLDAAPITNSTAFGLSLAATSRSLARDALLERLMPMPASSERLTIDSVLKFKERHAPKAARFRERLEAECVLVSSLSDPARRQEQVHAIATKLRHEVEEIADAMKMNWKMVVFGGILPVLSAAAPIADADWKTQAFAAAGAVGSVGAAVYQGAQALSAAQVAQNRPLAYVALAQKHLLA
jgi:hypothetical protein